MLIQTDFLLAFVLWQTMSMLKDLVIFVQVRPLGLLSARLGGVIATHAHVVADGPVGVGPNHNGLLKDLVALSVWLQKDVLNFSEK